MQQEEKRREEPGTNLPWCPLKRKCSVPAMRFATQTCRTSCGSAVVGFASTMFSTAMVKTLPLASQASAEGGSVGRTNMTGPETSDGASAATQVSSSGAASSPASSALRSCLLAEEGPAAPVSSSSLSATRVRLRFLGLSPLKDSGLTMAGAEGGGDSVCRSGLGGAAGQRRKVEYLFDLISVADFGNGTCTVEVVLSRAGGCALLRQAKVKFGDGGFGGRRAPTSWEELERG